MRNFEGLLLGWPYKSSGGKELVDYENPIIDKKEGHIYTSAMTGEGKGVSYSVPALLSWPGSVVALDIKGELSEITARHRQEMGQDVYILDPFGITKFESDKLNPLDSLDINDPGIVADVSELFELMVSDLAIKDDPFWHKSAKSALSAISLELLEQRGSGNVTLEDVGDMLDNPNEPRLDEMVVTVDGKVIAYPNVEKLSYKEMYKLKQDAPSFQKDMMKSDIRLVRKCAHLFRRENTRTKQAIEIIASEALSIAEGGQVSQAMNSTTIPLQDLVNGKPMTLYIVIPPEKLLSHAKVLRVWIGQLFSSFYKRRRWSGPETLLLLDEMAQLGHMNEFLTSMTLLRSYGVKVWSIWQDPGQLMKTYQKDWRTVLNNCRTQIWFGFVNQIIASQAAEMIGGFTPDELFKMNPRDAVLVRDRQVPEIIRRPNYLQQDMWQNCYDSNPYYGQQEQIDIENIKSNISHLWGINPTAP